MTGSNGDSGDVAMEGKMAGVVAGVRGMDLEEGGKRGLDCSTKSSEALELLSYCSAHLS
jgi:hypothetical protein